MSKIVFVVAVAICLAQGSVGRVVREAPAPAEDGWTTIWNSANETFSALNSAFLRIVNAEDNSDLIEKIQTTLKSLANEVEANTLKLTKETEPLTGKARELVKAFTDKASEISEKLKLENPELVDKNVREISEQAAKLNERLKAEGAVVSEKALGFLKVIADNAVSTAGQLKTQIEAAIAPKTT